MYRAPISFWRNKLPGIVMGFRKIEERLFCRISGQVIALLAINTRLLLAFLLSSIFVRFFNHRLVGWLRGGVTFPTHII